MSIIQEALKKAQDSYTLRKSPPQVKEAFVEKAAVPIPMEVADKRTATKNIFSIIYIVALLVLVAGFGIRTIFSKMVSMDKERRSNDLTIVERKAPPVKQAPASIPAPAVEQSSEKSAAFVPSEQINQPPNLTLNGIMYVGERPRAIINGTVVIEGDVIDGATVTSISENKVLVKYNNSDNKVEMALRLKE